MTIAAAHFGNTTAGSNASVQYVIATATRNNSNGFDSSWCAYHSSSSSQYGNLAYTNLPYITDADASCGANFNGLGATAGITIVAGTRWRRHDFRPRRSCPRARRLRDYFFLELATLAGIGLHRPTALVLPRACDLPADLTAPRAPFALRIRSRLQLRLECGMLGGKGLKVDLQLGQLNQQFIGHTLYVAVLQPFAVRSQAGCEHDHLCNRVIQRAHDTLV